MFGDMALFGRQKACGQAGHFDCTILDSFTAAPPFEFSKFQQHALFKVTAANGVSAVFKVACDPDKIHKIRQPWMEEYAFELSRLFGMRNVPCVRSKRFFLDEIRGSMTRDELAPEFIFKEGKREFLIGSITALIPDLVARTVTHFPKPEINPQSTHKHSLRVVFMLTYLVSN
jgi:hypothetical protein